MGEEMLTPEQAADELKLSLKTIKDYLREKKLRGTKFGRVWRIRRSDLEEFKCSGVPAAPRSGGETERER